MEKEKPKLEVLAQAVITAKRTYDEAVERESETRSSQIRAFNELEDTKKKLQAARKAFADATFIPGESVQRGEVF